VARGLRRYLIIGTRLLGCLQRVSAHSGNIKRYLSPISENGKDLEERVACCGALS
jgi:hypothetical protein